MAYFDTTDDRVPFPDRFVGSNLFGDGKFVKKCFSTEDVALLSARNKFEVYQRFSKDFCRSLLCVLCRRSFLILRYHQMIWKMTDPLSRC